MKYEEKKVLDIAIELFEVKPFAIRYAPIKTAATIISPILSLFSIVTGFGFLYYVFVPSMGLYGGVVCALVLLAIIEFGKRLIGREMFRDSYSKQTTTTGLILLAIMVVMVGISGFLSVKGAEELVHRTTDKIAIIETTNRTYEDSIKQAFNILITSEKKSLEAFKKSVSWKGQIDVSNRAVQEAILASTTRVKTLEDNLLKNLEISTYNKENDKATARQRTNFDSAVWVVIAGLVELLIIICVWFPVHYYHTVFEDRLRRDYEDGIADKRVINVGSSDVINQALLEDLEKGETRFNILAAKYGVNATTIKKHKLLLT